VRVSLPPYLSEGTPSQAAPEGPAPPPRNSRRRIGVLLAVVAVLSAGAGALVTSRVESDASPSTTSTTELLQRIRQPFGPPESLGNWTVAVQKWSFGSARNVVRVAITNASDKLNLWIGYEQVMVRYEIPSLSGKGRWYVRSPDHGSERVLVDPRTTVLAEYIWNIPECARNVVLMIRNRIDEEDMTEVLFGQPTTSFAVGPLPNCTQR
jgi:hypothetical protein